jgi:hypothetical protein
MATIEHNLSAPPVERSRRLKGIATGLILIPVGGIVILAFAGVIEGEWLSIFELAFALPLLALAWLGWRYPRIVGLIFIAFGIGIFTSLWIDMWDNTPISELLTAIVVMLAAPVATGVLFVTAGHLEQQRKLSRS